MATKKSFLEMHNAVGGSYSSPERVQQEQERNQKRQEKTAEINRQAVTQPKQTTQKAVSSGTSTGNQKKSTALSGALPGIGSLALTGEKNLPGSIQGAAGGASAKIPAKRAPTPGVVQDINQLLFSAADRKQAVKKGQDPMFAYVNSEVGRAKEEATKQISTMEQTIKELQGKKKPVGMDRTNVPYNEEIDSQIAALQGQIDSTRQQAADMNDILISAMPEGDRKLLEKYAEVKRNRAGRDASVSMSGGIPLPWLENLLWNPNSDEYSALKEKYGEEQIDQLAETLIRQSNAQEVQQMQEAGVKAGAEHPFLGSLLSIPTNVMAGATSVLGRAAELGTRTGQYPTLDPNNPYNIGTYGSSIQGQVASDIEGEDPNFWRKAGSYAYRGGMSALESGLRAATGKAGTVLLSGLGSFEQNVAKASAQGASPEKAVLLGLTNATIEALSEEIPLDNLLDAAKGGKQTFKQALNLALAQAGIEATTEVVSLIGSTLAEAAILQEKSEFNQYIQSRMAEGVDYHTAWDEAFQNLLGEAVDTAIVSAVSGGGMSGVNSLVTNYEANKQAKNQPSTQPQLDTSAETGPQPQQESTQAHGTPLQGEAADPRQLAQQQEQAREAAQAMEQEQQAQAAQQEAQQAPPATDPMLEGIQTPVTPAQEQSQQTAPGRELLDTAIAETMGQNQDQQQAPAAVDTQKDTAKPANAVLDKATNATIAEGSVKSQIRRSQESLNAMDAVAEIQTPSQFSAMDKSQINPEQQVQTDTTGKQSTPSGEFKASRTYTNSGLRSSDADIRAAYRDDVRRYKDNPYYEVKRNEDTMATAEARVNTPEKVSAEYDYLMGKDAWTAEDNTAARLASRELFKQGDGERSSQLNKKIQNINTNAGQIVQSNSQFTQQFTMKDASNPATTAETAVGRIEAMEQKDTTYKQKENGPSFEEWKESISQNITEIAIEIDAVEDGDTASMLEIIRKIAKQRKTTAWFGAKDRLSAPANAILNTLQFSDLKRVADTQLLSMTDDFRRRGVSEVFNGVRKTSMLSAITTFKRNLQGNSAVGLLDSLGDSTTGAIMDRLLSKITGKRTTSNDFFRPISYLKAAKNSGSFASLCVELNIPIETDVESSYASAYGEDTGGKYVAKTFRSTGNIGMRALYAYQKYQSYALEVSDKVFEGGTKGAVDASLEKLKGLNADERQRLTDYTANRRTFKDATWEGPDGRTHGSTLSRAAQYVKKGAGNLGEYIAGDAGRAVGEAAADYVVPFVQVPTNVAQTGVDYSTGVFKGAAEMVSLIVDAKKGVDIPVERQRQAVSDFGRGMTGLALISLATVAAHYGIIRVGDDDDKDADALHQSEGRNGVQINWSAWKRAFSGEPTEWRSTDILSSLDSVEPFNTHMYLGVELAQEDDFLGIMKAYPKATFESSFNAFMDSPMVTGLREMGEDVTEIARSDDKAETITENLAEGAGSYVASYIPQFVRQIAQATDGYYRDTRGDTKLETAVNQVKASIPGLSQTLSVKVDGLGNPQTRPNAWSIFTDPNKTTRYQPNEVTVALDALAEQTGDKSIYPDYQAPMKITLGGEEIPLDGTARTTYQMTYGNSVDTMYRGLLSSPGFSSLPQDAQMEALNKAERYAAELAKASVANNPDAPVESLEELVPKILSDTVTKQFTDAFRGISNDQKFGRDTAESIASLENAYNVYSALPDELRDRVDKDSGGKVSDYMAAKEAGMSTNDFAKMYMVKSSFDDAFDSLTHAWEYDKDPASAVSALEDAYSVYSGMGPKERKEFKENTGGKVGYFLDAKDAGIDGETFTELYKTYSDIDAQDSDASAKARNWAYYLNKEKAAGRITTAQEAKLKDSMAYYNIFPADAGKFNGLTEAGLSADTAQKVVGLMDGITGTGKDGHVRNIDKYTAIAGSGLSAKDKETAFLEYAPDAMDDKYNYAKKNMTKNGKGITIDDFVRAYQVTDEYSKKKEQTDAWQAMGYTKAEAENLYKLYDGKLT